LGIRLAQWGQGLLASKNSSASTESGPADRMIPIPPQTMSSPNPIIMERHLRHVHARRNASGIEHARSAAMSTHAHSTIPTAEDLVGAADARLEHHPRLCAARDPDLDLEHVVEARRRSIAHARLDHREREVRLALERVRS
jgi:hypothetical protein